MRAIEMGKTTRGRAAARFAALATGLLCLAGLQAATKGPDAAQYTGTDSTVYSFADISATGARVLADTDDGAVLLALPFNFQFYGQTYSTICASSNGLLTFVAAAACGTAVDFANTDLTVAGPPDNPAAILPFWSDLTFQVPGGGAVYYKASGSSPNRQFIIQWQNAYPQGSANPVTFQVILSETSNSILFQYKTVNLGAGNAASQGAAATVGIRDAGGLASNRQIAWSYNAAVLADASAILFTVPSATTSVNTVTSVPTGLAVSIDGVSYTTPKVVNWTVGTSHTLAAATPQVFSTMRQSFASWSMGGAATTNVTAQAGGATYTATFATEYQLTTSVQPAGAGTVSGAGWYSAGTTATVKASNAGGYRFYNWSGDASGTTNPTSVVMSAARSVTANYLAIPPAVTLGRNQLYFGAITGGALTTPGQEVAVSVTTPTTAWTAVSTQSWLQVAPTSGTGSSKITVSLVGASLPASGTVTGAINVTMAGDPTSLPITCTAKVMAAGGPPVGAFDTPAAGATVASSIPVTGWALDDLYISNVKLYRDPVAGEPFTGMVYIGDAVFVPGARSDVETAYPTTPFNYRGGWGYMMLTNSLPGQGNGTFKLYAVATNISGTPTTLGTKTITVDNAHATKPFGAIGLPAQGATVSGAAYTNRGWALTPSPGTIAADGSTMYLFIDGQRQGNVVYGDTRTDVDAVFPGYSNTGHSGGHYVIDTTQFANGMHSVAWRVGDNLSRADGVGSRYFYILNVASGGQTPATPAAGKAPAQAMVRTGYSDTTPLRPVEALKVDELERVELQLPAPEEGTVWRGAVVVSGEQRALPVGSLLNAAGVFTWQLGPGFLGDHELLFTSGSKTVRLPVRIGAERRSERQ